MVLTCPRSAVFFGHRRAGMFYADHEPPHFHVRYSGQKALIAIETLARTLLRRASFTSGVGSGYRVGCAASPRADGRLDTGTGRSSTQAHCTSGVNMLKDYRCRKCARRSSAAPSGLSEDGVEGVVDLAHDLSFRGCSTATARPRLLRTGLCRSGTRYGRMAERSGSRSRRSLRAPHRETGPGAQDALRRSRYVESYFARVRSG